MHAISDIEGEQFTKKLTLDQDKLDSWEKAITVAEANCGIKSQRYPYTIHSETLTYDDEFAARIYPTWMKGCRTPIAQMFGYIDHLEFQRVSDYLQKNNRFLHPVSLMCFST